MQAKVMTSPGNQATTVAASPSTSSHESSPVVAGETVRGWRGLWAHWRSYHPENSSWARWQPSIRQTALVLAGLFLLTLAPRLLAAWYLDEVAPDAVFYILAAQAYEQGKFDAATSGMSLNVYPAILAVLHQLGLDYEMAGKLWGATIASLAIVPIWGLFRRQFSAAVATLSVALYAVHPRLIQWSVEPVRDATWWFLFACTLYCLNRATTSAGLRWYLVMAVAMALAIYTRTEAWLLCLPAAVATFLSLRNAGPRRLRQLLGLALCLILMGSAVAGLNIWSRGSVRQVARIDLVDTVWNRVQQRLSGAPQQRELQARYAPQAVTTPGAMAHDYAQRLFKAFGPLVGLLCLSGLCRFARRNFEPDLLPILLMNLALLLSVVAYLFAIGEINTRYFLPIVICSLPFAALTCLCLPVDLAWWGCGPVLRSRLLTGLGLALLLSGVVDGATIKQQARRDEAAVAHFLHQQLGAGQELAGHDFFALRARYYTHCRKYLVLPQWIGDSELDVVRTEHPAALIIQGTPELLARWETLVAEHPELGLKPLDLSALAPTSRGMRVFWDVSRTGTSLAQHSDEEETR